MKALSKKELPAQVMVALDAIEEEDPRAQQLLAPILAVVTKHGEREGALDYKGRAEDVAAGRVDPEWAWPFAGADDAYLNAVGTDKILREIGIPNERLWEHISDTWLEAFERGYSAAHADEAGKPKKAAQLDREIARALGEQLRSQPRRRRRGQRS